VSMKPAQQTEEVAGCNRRPLVRWHDVPPELQDNPYLLQGYRGIGLTHCECMCTAFGRNNQTWNVWTSVGGLFLFLFISGHVFTSFDFSLHPIDLPIFAFFLSASVMMNIISGYAHLFSATSVLAHEILFSLDWAWIAILFISRALGLAHYHFPIKGYAMFFAFLVLSCTSLSFAVSIYLARCRIETPKWIRIAIVIPSVIIMELPVIYRICNGTATWEAILVLVFMGGGALMFAKHFPERVRPELFDCGFYSHPIWHTCYISANYYDTLALLQDYCVERSLQVKMSPR